MKNMLCSSTMSEGGLLQEHLLKIKDIFDQVEAIG